MAAWVAIAIALISAAGTGAAWLRTASQNKVDEAEAELTQVQVNQMLREQLHKAQKDLDQAWMRLRDVERALENDRLVILKLLEIAQGAGFDLEEWNGNYADWLARQAGA